MLDLQNLYLEVSDHNVQTLVIATVQSNSSCDRPKPVSVVSNTGLQPSTGQTVCFLLQLLSGHLCWGRWSDMSQGDNRRSLDGRSTSRLWRAIIQALWSRAFKAEMTE
jgi:hypothetical protein